MSHAQYIRKGPRASREEQGRRLYSYLVSQGYSPEDAERAVRHARSGRWANAMTERRARIIRDSETRFERSRAAHDPKRYKRGGGYTPEELKSIARGAGLSRHPSNRAKEALAVHEFMRDKPAHVFAYYDDAMKHVQLWSKKSTVGDITWKGPVQRRMGGRVQAIRVRGYNGVHYHGIANLSSGTYVRLHAMKGTRRR